MAENDPGKDENKDIWSKRPKREGPPDLDELINKLQRKINSIFVRKGDSQKKASGSLVIGLVFLIIIVIWALSGIFIVSPAAAVVKLQTVPVVVPPALTSSIRQ